MRLLNNKITLTNVSEAWYNGKDTVTLGGRDAVIIAFCAAELISICETAGLMGILPKPVQQILVKAIDILSSKIDKEG